MIFTVVVMELESYSIHRLSHRVPCLWRLHAVHHSDTDFDLTTAYRSHPLEGVFLFIVRGTVIVLLGAPVYAIVIYEAARVAQDLFGHSNVRIPSRVESWLRYVIVTPDFHRLHHSSNSFFTDSNYSATFPWFDYLFGSVSNKPYAEHVDLEIGLEYFRSSRDTRIDQLLLMPFRNFRQLERRPERERFIPDRSDSKHYLTS
jgi:sterol desaturase/sphingolipid hydroxylase (fatty acid hydroxylase superfamily)